MKPRPVEDGLLSELARRHGTPLYVYDAATVRERVRRLKSLAPFDVLRYAQKANPNLSLLELLRGEGVLVDAVSAGEVARALAAGYRPEEVLFCADLFDAAGLRAVAEHEVAVNLGSPDMLEQIAEVRPGAAVVLRINPGFGHGHDTKVRTGGELSKHGIWHRDLPRVAARARELGLIVRGLHVHIGSGVEPEHLGRVGEALASCARVVPEGLEMVSAGGGLPIPYREHEAPLDLEAFGAAWGEARSAIEAELSRSIQLELEPGRYLVAEAGLLLCEVRGTKRTGSLDYVLVDAGFHNLARPVLYGAWHEITLLGAEGRPLGPKVVAGPLCESADVFTQRAGGLVEPRELPEARVGDLLCVHDAGAYGASMASRYNSQPLAAEVLVEHGEGRLVRARETFEDLLRLERVDAPPA